MDFNIKNWELSWKLFKWYYIAYIILAIILVITVWIVMQNDASKCYEMESLKTPMCVEETQAQNNLLRNIFLVEIAAMFIIIFAFIYSAHKHRKKFE